MGRKRGSEQLHSLSGVEAKLLSHAGGAVGLSYHQ